MKTLHERTEIIYELVRLNGLAGDYLHYFSGAVNSLDLDLKHYGKVAKRWRRVYILANHMIKLKTEELQTINSIINYKNVL